MEFEKNLQELRKQKGLTQEELAEALFVSRAAVSKWESGRGYPNIDSLKAIAQFYGVTVDSLLSAEAVLTIAETDGKKREHQRRCLVFGLLDLCCVMFFFLPLFGKSAENGVLNVSLPAWTAALWLQVLSYGIVVSLAAMGLLTLSLQNCTAAFWMKNQGKISLILGILGTALFIVSRQVYAAVFVFVFLMVKALMLIRWR